MSRVHGAVKPRWQRFGRSAARRIVQAATIALLLSAMGLAGPASTAQAQDRTAARSTAESGSQSTPASQSPEANRQESNKQETDENDAYRHSASVRVLGKMLGMSPESASSAFTLLNLLVLVGFVGWLLLRALPRFFRDRTSHIQKQLVDARSATEEANARLSNVEGRLSRLDADIAALRTQAEKDAGTEEERMRASVEEEKAKVLAAAEQEIAATAMQARRQIQQFAAELAIEQAAKKLVVSAETDRLLVQEFTRRLGENTPRGGQN